MIKKILEKLYSELFDLRSLQANCTVNERANIESKINKTLKKIDSYERL